MFAPVPRRNGRPSELLRGVTQTNTAVTNRPLGNAERESESVVLPQ